jgi:hypothetical protein
VGDPRRAGQEAEEIDSNAIALYGRARGHGLGIQRSKGSTLLLRRAQRNTDPDAMGTVSLQRSTRFSNHTKSIYRGTHPALTQTNETVTKTSHQNK